LSDLQICGQYASPYEISSKSVIGCRDIAFNVFQNGGSPPSCICEISISEQLVCSGGVIFVIRAKFLQNWSNDVGDIAIFRFSR